ncbi:pentapeptide repeat-containing protein [Nostoc sp.]|uniref:pentapeptide repeat-containing protein n=1 Tax=Nostoc sp. TaxID=1180 RepID=UPI002FF734EC
MKELQDRELVRLYKAGERNFCNFRLHNEQRYIALGGLLVGYCSANFSNENLTGINLSGSDLNYVNLENANLSRANLSDANLSSANLNGANLNGVNLKNANLIHANLKNSNFCGVDLTNTFLVSAILKGMIVDENTKFDYKNYLIWEIVNQGAFGRNLSGVDLTGACLEDADLREVNLSNAKLGYFSFDDDKKIILYESNLKRANLTEANLEYAQLRGANLENAILGKANLERVNLYESDLKKAKLDRANLNYADLSEARLINTNFRQASLYKAVLYGAKLSGSSWVQTDLRKSNFDQTSLNSASTLREAYYDEETIFPKGFEPKSKRMVYVTKDYKYVEFVKKLLTLGKIKNDKSPPPRPGQEEFRKALTEIYGTKYIIISGCDIEEAIEAAHIIPYRNQDSHNIANGLLLRVDLHIAFPKQLRYTQIFVSKASSFENVPHQIGNRYKLFDKYLLTIHPETSKVLIAPELMNSYKDILGKTLETRLCGEDAINHKYVLDDHYQKFRSIESTFISI